MGPASGPAFGRAELAVWGVGAPASALGVGFLPGVALYPPLTPCSMGFRLVFRCGIVAALRSLVACPVCPCRVWLCAQRPGVGINILKTPAHTRGRRALCFAVGSASALGVRWSTIYTTNAENSIHASDTQHATLAVPGFSEEPQYTYYSAYKTPQHTSLDP